MNYGVLSREEAERINKRLLDAKKKGLKSSITSPPTKKKKVKVEEDASGDADMKIDGPDRVGSKTL